MSQESITRVPGIKVGHATDLDAITGCTVILCEGGAVGGVEVRGSAPGTRETDLLRPMQHVERVHAVLLTGGSAFGLAAADGVMRYLEERGIGYDVGVTKVPIVPAAVLFDLRIGDFRIRPNAEMGYQACLEASAGPPAEGSVGAGTGATVGKLLGMASAMKGGIGTWALSLPGGVVVGAIVAVNAFGDIVDDRTGKILAGARDPSTGAFLDTAKALFALPPPGFPDNTTIGVVATNARLTKEQANKLAQLSHNGLARTVSPAHTMVDGDTMFVLATGEVEANFFAVGAAAVEVVATAVKRAVLQAEGLGGIPSIKDLQPLP
ncbi:MAG: P1 family peptidase [Armatimonadota bacterium]|nr:P1 family peptidase [Armatimonadota bacterium]MDR5702103.1 P1 family peptidase [Armatimonadota bacterium]MDR7434167.1 P1 family peptidase [Armatimonadota bacterium]